MKKLLIAAILLSASATHAQNKTFGPGATPPATISPIPGSNGEVFNGYLVNQPGLAYNNQYVIDMSQYDASRVSVEVLYSSAVIANQTFSDGKQSTGTFTLLNNPAVLTSTITLTVNGSSLVEWKQWNAAVSSITTVSNISSAINTAQGSVITSTFSAGALTVNLTSVLNGVNAFGLATSNSADISVSSPTMLFGSNANFALNSSAFSGFSSQINLTLALPVLYTIGTDAIGGLTSGTTYYVVPINSYSFDLATCSSCAVNGLSVNYVVITSTNSGATGFPHTYTLAPVKFGGNSASGINLGGTVPSLVLQASNDDANWVTAPSTGTITISTVTALNPGSSTQVNYDGGFYDFRYIRLNVVAPNGGGLNLQVPVYLKQDGIGRF